MAQNARATDSYVGDLLDIPYCSLNIPLGAGVDDAAMNSPNGPGVIKFRSMPTITDSKGAKYDPAPVIGRSMPILTYAYSEVRQISLDIPFIACKTSDFALNAMYLRWIASAVYPRLPTDNCPYKPPPVCTLQFGAFFWLFNNDTICVILDKYTVKNDPSVPSDPETLIPVKFTVNTSWQVVYESADLPWAERIVDLGR